MLETKNLKNWIKKEDRPFVIAGPCSAESEHQVLHTAIELQKNATVKVFRAGIWKPRTRPNCFEGVGSVGLPWLKKVKEQTRLLTCTEVATPTHVEECLKHEVDILWVGARTAANPFSVQAIADALRGVDIPVMIKNPINADLSLWFGAVERIMGAGINQLAAIHRGFSSGEKNKYRNQPKWKIPIEFKRLAPEIPLICDPSHITGNRELVGNVCQKAMDLDMDGLMVETHMTPKEAWSDAAQQVTPDALFSILTNLTLRNEFSADQDSELQLEKLREQIDQIDNEILEALKHRMSVIEKIATTKKLGKITPFQRHRLDQLMKDRIGLGNGLGLSEEYTKGLFNIIHEQSVKKQTEIINNFIS